MSLFVGVAIYYVNSDHNPKTLYVNNSKLFSEFNMTKDIKSIEEKKIKAKGKYLDSIYNAYQISADKESETSKKLQNKIALLNKEFQDLQNNYTNNLTQKVWLRLNTYIDDYCKLHEIKIVFGTNGNGNIMFADETYEITNQILKYCNEKYEDN